MRFVIWTLLAAATVGAAAWHIMPPSKDRVDAEEAFSALCREGAAEASPQTYTLCTELRQQLRLAVFREPWQLIAETSSAAAHACAPLTMMQDTPSCRVLNRQINQLTFETLTRAFPSAKPLDADGAARLYQDACGRGQARASAEATSNCSDAANMLAQGQKHSTATFPNQYSFMSAVLAAAQNISDACWPRGATGPSPTAPCQSVRWAWIGNDKSLCQPELNTLQNRNLTEQEQIQAAMRYMRQPAVCFW